MLTSKVWSATGALELSLVLCDDEHISELNLEWMEKEGPTDVLSFPLDDEDTPPGYPRRVLGDLIVSLDTAARQAAERRYFWHPLWGPLSTLYAAALQACLRLWRVWVGNTVHMPHPSGKQPSGPCHEQVTHMLVCTMVSLLDFLIYVAVQGTEFADRPWDRGASITGTDCNKQWRGRTRCVHIPGC